MTKVAQKDAKLCLNKNKNSCPFHDLKVSPQIRGEKKTEAVVI